MTNNTTSLIKAKGILKDIEKKMVELPEFDRRWVKDKKFNSYTDLLASVITGFSWNLIDLKNYHKKKLLQNNTISALDKDLNSLKISFLSAAEKEKELKEKINEERKKINEIEERESILKREKEEKKQKHNECNINIAKLEKEKILLEENLKKEIEKQKDLENDNESISAKKDEISSMVSNYEKYLKYEKEIKELEKYYREKNFTLRVNEDKNISTYLEKKNYNLQQKVNKIEELIEEIEKELKNKILKNDKEYERTNNRRK